MKTTLTFHFIFELGEAKYELHANAENEAKAREMVAGHLRTMLDELAVEAKERTNG